MAVQQLERLVFRHENGGPPVNILAMASYGILAPEAPKDANDLVEAATAFSPLEEPRQRERRRAGERRPDIAETVATNLGEIAITHGEHVIEQEHSMRRQNGRRSTDQPWDSPILGH